MLLRAEDALPGRPRRVAVAGASGSGKTTMARQLAAALGLPCYELDALFHGPGWVPRPTFVEEVHAFAATPAWVCEWQYSQVRDVLAERAELVVWLDLPRRTVMRQISVRTAVRRWHRTELWNGNVEGPLWTVLTDPDHVVRWAWTSHAHLGAKIDGLLLRWPELPVVALRSRREVEHWLAGPLAAVARTTPPELEPGAT